MKGTSAAEGAGSIARVLRAEGLAAVRDRVWDRVRDASVRARVAKGGRDPWPAASVLNVIGVPMTTVFGGVPLQLRARLRRESMTRTVAVLSREPGGRGADVGRGGVGAAAASAAADADRGAGTAARAGAGADAGTGASAGAGAWRLESWSGGRPRRAMTFAAGDWDGDPLRDDPAWLHAVRTAVGLVSARAVHVENAAGLSLVSLSVFMGIDASADAARIPVVLSVHDLSLFSRHPHLPPPSPHRHPLEQRLKQQRLQQRRSDAAPYAKANASTTLDVNTNADADTRTNSDTGANANASANANEGANETLVDDRQRFEHAFHHALGTGILRAAAFTIYPSRFMRNRIETLPHVPAHIVAPGIEPPSRTLRSARRPDQIALLGGGQEHKGGARLVRVAAALAARGMQVTSYGGYGHEHLLQMRGIKGVRVRGYYRAGSLSTLLAGQGASVALILSAVPESFSLVLSEAWAAGVPVVAPVTGAFPERISPPDAAAGGLLVSAASNYEDIVATVERAARMSWNSLPTPPTALQAAERHVALYRAAGFMTRDDS